MVELPQVENKNIDAACEALRQLTLTIINRMDAGCWEDLAALEDERQLQLRRLFETSGDALNQKALRAFTQELLAQNTEIVRRLDEFRVALVRENDAGHHTSRQRKAAQAYDRESER